MKCCNSQLETKSRNGNPTKLLCKSKYLKIPRKVLTILNLFIQICKKDE